MEACLGFAGLPEDVWCKTLSFVLRGSHCLKQIGAVSHNFSSLTQLRLSWEGSSVCISPLDLEEIEDTAFAQKECSRYPFQALVSSWELCTQAFLNFEGAHVGKKRMAATSCFALLTRDCCNVAGLCVRNWCMAERGIAMLGSGSLPRLRHLELTGCDQISTYQALIPIFQSHPSLLSLRASFSPRAEADLSFAASAPRTLEALGFVRFNSPGSMVSLLNRCPDLKHLWLSATGNFPAAMTAALEAAAPKLLTLSLPSEASEEICLQVARACPSVQLLCRMRIGSTAFGTGALAADFEALPSGQGVVVRRRGSKSDLTANGSLWAPPHSEDATPLPPVKPCEPRVTSALTPPLRTATGRAELAISASRLPRSDATSLAAMVAAAARSRQNAINGRGNL
mmetsp:Transcript_16296/g.26046  ORF Transcript_16296/g.26046 Transcript_16296/m.26046 type:complete len:398 (+) Transcript_16296:83-1276(+)